MIEKDKLLNLIDQHFPYPSSRDGQKEAIEIICKAFIHGATHFLLEAPTGVGKSGIASTVQKVIYSLYGERSTISTRSKALQDQYNDEYKYLVDIRSKTNYHCPMGADHYDTVECKIERYKKRCNPAFNCPYVIQRNNWSYKAIHRMTNHSFLSEACGAVLNNPESRSGLIILDECHTLENVVLDHSLIRFNIEDCDVLEKIDTLGVEDIRIYISKILSIMKYNIDDIISIDFEVKDNLRQLQRASSGLYDDIDFWVRTKIENNEHIPSGIMASLSKVENLKENCDILLSVKESNAKFAIRELENDKLIAIQPTKAKYTSQYALFRKADKFLHMSATICGFNQYCNNMGIDISKTRTLSMESPFKKTSRSIFYIPVEKFTKDNRDNALREISKASDSIIEKHKGQRGIIHTVSYVNAEYLVENSKNSKRLFVPKTPKEGIEFLEEIPDGILVSPAMEEGYDLNGDMSRFQILIKVPYPFLGDCVIKYNMEQDYSGYIRMAIMRMVQASGRSIRSEEDFATTYILDKSFHNIYIRNGQMLPEWWKSAVSLVELKDLENIEIYKDI